MSGPLRMPRAIARLALASVGALALAAPAPAQATLFPVEHAYASSPATFGCALARIDADGVLDLAVANYNGAQVSLYGGVGNGTFTPQGSVPTGIAPRSVVFADFNADGYPDLAAACAGNNNVAVALGQGAFVFAPTTTTLVGDFPVWVDAGDVNGDQKIDIVCASQSGEEISVLLGDGLGGFAAAVSYPLGYSAEQMRLGDLDSNGSLDVVVCSWLDDRVITMLNNGSGVFTIGTSFYSDSPKGLAVHDFDSDGNLDAVVSSTSVDAAFVLRGNGAGGFFPPRPHQVGNYPVSVAVADFTNDGRSDIVTVNAGDDSLTVLVNIGQCDFNLAQHSPIPFASQYVAAGDLNGDNRSDVAVTYYATSLVRSHLATEFTGWERYCTAKVNSLGCTPTIAASGSPSATNLRPFRVFTYNLIATTPGIFAYKVNGARGAIPFQGGTLCIDGGGLRRSPGTVSGGKPLTCEGVFQLDFNAFAAGLAGGNPSPALQTPGADYLVQTWARDPGSAPFFSSLSAALEVEIGP